MFIKLICPVLVCMLTGVCLFAEAQQKDDDLRSMSETRVILLNVAVKARLVQRLASEMTRIEVIRALLLTYARQCVKNVTEFENSCRSCIRRRCSERLEECKLNEEDLSQVKMNGPSAIPGVQFLKSSYAVRDKMREFTDTAKADILIDVPRKLRSDGEKLVKKNIEKSLDRLDKKIESEGKAGVFQIRLLRMGSHFPSIDEIRDRMSEVAQSIGTALSSERTKNMTIKLKSNAKPIFMTVHAASDAALEHMPGMMEKIGETVGTFVDKFMGLVTESASRAVKGFKKGKGDEEEDETSKSQSSPASTNQNSQTALPASQQLLSSDLHTQNQQQLLRNQQLIQQNSQLLQNRRILQNGQLANGQVLSGQLTNGQILSNGQLLQKTQLTNQQTGNNLLNGRTNRWARFSEPPCEELEQDVRQCEHYEEICSDCRRGKQLVFDECGSGVEKAKDELTRLDETVLNYLDTYQKFIAKGPVVVKVELNEKEKAPRRAAYKKSYITARIGPSITRYQSSQAIDLNQLGDSGRNLGDEIWKKLWEEHVFVVAERLDLDHKVQFQTSSVEKQPAHSGHTGHSAAASNLLRSTVSSAICCLFTLAVAVFVF